MAECIKSVRLTTQLGGTCWFHSTVNGFLFTDRGRRLLNTTFRMYTEKTFQPKYNYLTTCPRRNQLDLNSFWRYIMYRLGKIPLFPGEIKAIRNLRSNASVSTGNYKDLILMCQKVFGRIEIPYNRQNLANNKSRIGPSPVFIDWTLDPEFITRYPLGNSYTEFILNHIYVSIADDDEENKNAPGHSVTAFTCKNDKYIYDSNDLRPRKLDWTDKDKLIKYAKKYAGIKVPFLTYYCVYIRKEI